MMASSSIHLGLGSNVGDRAANLDRAISALGKQLEIITLSSLYETEPVGYSPQQSFFNLACHAITSLSPKELLHFTQAIESSMGRLATFRNGPRVIDIDILLFGQLQVHDDDLVIPHRSLPERMFVLAPLCEIAPDAIHPALGKTIRQLTSNCPDRHWVRRLDGGENVSTVC